MAIEDDTAYYFQVRLELLARYLGRFVLIRDRRLVGAYGTYDEALADAVARFGPDYPGLIRQVLDPEPVERI